MNGAQASCRRSLFDCVNFAQWAVQLRLFLASKVCSCSGSWRADVGVSSGCSKAAWYPSSPQKQWK